MPTGLRLFLALYARQTSRRGRTLLSVLGVALGVALGYGVHLVNRAAVEDLAAGVRALSGDADLEVRGGRGGFSEQVYVAVAKLPGIAATSPMLDLEAGLADGGALRVIGIDPLRAAQLYPGMFAHQPQLMLELLRPDTALLSANAAEAMRLGKGAKLALVAGLATVELEVAGTLRPGAPHGIAALTDISTAQWRLQRLGELNRIGIRLAPGANREAMRERVQAVLPAGVYVTPVETEEASGRALSRAYRVNLNVLALVALFTGAFLVFSAQALEVARRRGEHALLRVLGLERAGLARLVLAEAALVGAAGALLGVALGYLFALAAVRASGGDLGAGMFRGLAPEVSFARRARRSPISRRASRWRSRARSCPRSRRRARRPRRRSRRATSSGSSRARCGCARPCCCLPRRSSWRSSRRCGGCRSSAMRRSPACWWAGSCSCPRSRAGRSRRCR